MSSTQELATHALSRSRRESVGRGTSARRPVRGARGRKVSFTTERPQVSFTFSSADVGVLDRDFIEQSITTDPTAAWRHWRAINGPKQTALLRASAKGHIEVVVKLLRDKGAAVDEKNRTGETALAKASVGGHTEVAKLLLDMGASIDEKDKVGRTALVRASIKGHTEVVKLLLDKGASVDEKSLLALVSRQRLQIAAASNNKHLTASNKAAAEAVLQCLTLARRHRARAAEDAAVLHKPAAKGSSGRAVAEVRRQRAAGLAGARGGGEQSLLDGAALLTVTPMPRGDL
eukprot:scaffold85384_cov75-Phaeocystis_antarctica.AAC.1